MLYSPKGKTDIIFTNFVQSLVPIDEDRKVWYLNAIYFSLCNIRLDEQVIVFVLVNSDEAYSPLALACAGNSRLG